MPESNLADLDDGWLRAQLTGRWSLWRRLDVVAETGSTNEDLVARARAGEPAGSVLITGYQSAGRGRRGRSWTAPPGTAVAVSVLVAPAVPPARWTWLPLLAGLAVTEAVRRLTGLPAVLKWPNDVLVWERKVSGILAELVETPDGPACVVGMGINVNLSADDLPVPTATSLGLLTDGSPPSRQRVVVTVLRALSLLLREWEARGDDTSFAAAYVARCDTIGRRVQVLLPDGRVLEGEAEAVDADGRLVVQTDQRREAVGAGDVVHLRS